MSDFHKDLTDGSVSQHLIRFALPFLASNFLQAFYNVADMLIVGAFVGTNGVSAVGTAGQYHFLIISLITGLAVGGTVLIAQYLGAKQPQDAKESIATVLTLYIIVGAALTVIMLALTDPLLQAIQTPAESYADTRSYYIICMAGTLFICGYNAISAILRGMGDSKRPLFFVAIATVTNIILDLLFVGPLKMGSAGAALATIMAQAISLILSVIYLYRKDFLFDFKLKSFRLYKDKLRLLVKIGLPTSVQQTIVSFSFIFIVSLVNGFGVAASAGLGIAVKINSFAILPGLAISASVSSVAGQNIGALQYDRALKAMFAGMKIAFGISALIFVLVQLFPDPIVRVFTTPSDPMTPEVIKQSIAYLRSASFDYLVAAIFFAMNGLIIGAGRTTFSLITAAIAAIILRVPLSYLFSLTLGLGMSGPGLAAASATLGSIILSAIYIRKGLWKRRAIDAADSQPAPLDIM